MIRPTQQARVRDAITAAFDAAVDAIVEPGGSDGIHRRLMIAPADSCERLREALAAVGNAHSSDELLEACVELGQRAILAATGWELAATGIEHASDTADGTLRWVLAVCETWVVKPPDSWFGTVQDLIDELEQAHLAAEKVLLHWEIAGVAIAWIAQHQPNAGSRPSVLDVRASE